MLTLVIGNKNYSSWSLRAWLFLFGNFTIADVMYAPVVSRFVTYGVRLAAEAQTYAETLSAFPLIQEWLEAAAQKKCFQQI